MKYLHINRPLLQRLALLLICLVYVGLGIILPVRAHADPLSASEQQAVNEYPNYVDSCGSAGTASAPTTGSGSVYILGDSITALAESAYQAAFKLDGMSTVINAASSRSLTNPGTPGSGPDDTSDSGLDALKNDTKKIEQASAVVIALGTNGADTKANVDEAISRVKSALQGNGNSSAKVFWVNTFVYNRPSIVSDLDAANKVIDAESQTQGYSVLSWAGVVDQNLKTLQDTENLAGATDNNNYIIRDAATGLGVHPTPAGATALANMVASGVNASGSSSTGAPAACCPGSGSTSSSGGGGVGGSNNAKTAFDYLISNGNLTPIASAGLVGNFQQESGANLDPHANNGSHIGIAQWDVGGRWAQLLSVESGKDPYALKTQLDFVIYELNHGYKTSVFDPIQKAKNPHDAAYIVYASYEVPGDGSDPQREANAIKIYNLYAGSAPNPGTGSGGGCATGPIGTPTFVQEYGSACPSAAGMGHGAFSPGINALVIHFTQGNTEGCDLANFFAGDGGLGVQFNIGLKGTVYEYFPLNAMQVDWHVGQINGHAIGIEITGMDGEALLNNTTQFNAVVGAVKYLCDYYKIPCSDPKGDINGYHNNPDGARGLLGHSESPNPQFPAGNHSDPDTKIVGNVQYDIVNGQVWSDADRAHSNLHAYMMKLRQALGYNPTP